MQDNPVFTFGDTRLPERDTGSGCWVWMGARNAGGYGQLGWEGRTRQSHRFFYEALTGEKIPDGLTLDHV